MSKNFYITTTLPYVNADPHIGFAAEVVHADILARYAILSGKEAFFNTGTDEHGIKIYNKAREEGKDPQKYVDEHAEKFRNLKGALGLWQDVNFVRTTDEKHKEAAQEFWKLVDQNGYIYKKNYKVKYCIGCELEKTDSELAGGKCEIHPNLDIEIIEEENYFFKFSSFEDRLKKLYEDNPNFVIPDFRFNEIKSFVARGLEDFSISRLKKKMPWGVDVPGDPDQVMYVWFDALVNYIDVLDWPEDEVNFIKWWPGVQIAGKDNLRQQSAMWQAMLMAAGLPNSQAIIIRGFIQSGGHKMSKSLGNVINPYDLVGEYGTEAVRYFLVREINPFEDSEVSLERIKDSYNANLANGLGNLASRILTLSEKYLEKCPDIPEKSDFSEYFSFYEKFDIKQAADYVWDKIHFLDKRIQSEEPFKVIKIDQEKGKRIITELVVELYTIARMLNPIMPETNAMLKKLIKENKKPEKPLFMRKE